MGRLPLLPPGILLPSSGRQGQNYWLPGGLHLLSFSLDVLGTGMIERTWLTHKFIFIPSRNYVYRSIFLESLPWKISCVPVYTSVYALVAEMTHIEYVWLNLNWLDKKKTFHIKLQIHNERPWLLMIRLLFPRVETRSVTWKDGHFVD